MDNVHMLVNLLMHARPGVGIKTAMYVICPSQVSVSAHSQFDLAIQQMQKPCALHFYLNPSADTYHKRVWQRKYITSTTDSLVGCNWSLPGLSLLDQADIEKRQRASKPKHQLQAPKQSIALGTGAGSVQPKAGKVDGIPHKCDSQGFSQQLERAGAYSVPIYRILQRRAYHKICLRSSIASLRQ